MKAVPILILTNALALGLVVVLWVQQEDLKSQVSSSHSRADRGVSVSVADSDRIDQLESALASLRATRLAGETVATGAPTSDRTEDAGGAPIARGSSEGGEGFEPGMDEEFDPAEMTVFRRKVRKANELNAEEDRVQRVVDGLDRLIDSNRIGTLNENQKQAVASTIIEQRRRGPQMYRDLRKNNNNFEGMERTDIRALFSAVRDDLNAQAQKSLEEIVPAADAKTIVEETLNERWRGDGGVRSTPRPPRTQRTPRGGDAGRRGR